MVPIIWALGPGRYWPGRKNTNLISGQWNLGIWGKRSLRIQWCPLYGHWAQDPGRYWPGRKNTNFICGQWKLEIWGKRSLTIQWCPLDGHWAQAGTGPAAKTQIWSLGNENWNAGENEDCESNGPMNGATISVFYRGIEKLNTSRKMPTGNEREDMIVPHALLFPEFSVLHDCSGVSFMSEQKT